jgi:hypothetical protein
MPYIKPEDKPSLDPQIAALAAAIQTVADKYGYPGAFAGLLNYSVTTLALKLMPARRYWAIALMTGVMENIKQEFYRRYAVKYEDEQIAGNGDVY